MISVKFKDLRTSKTVIKGNMADAGDKKPEKEKESAEIKGWLYKWTNYIKGYQKRWFVLQNGLLSYYRYKNILEGFCFRNKNLGILSNSFFEDIVKFTINYYAVSILLMSS